MKLQLLQGLNNRGPPPPLPFKPDPFIGKKIYEKKDSLKVDINTQPCDING